MERFGYPLPLAAVLDPMSNHLGQSDEAIAFVRAWVDVVPPGCDLSPAPLHILRQFLTTSRAATSFPDLLSQIIALHQREAEGDVVPRSEWSSLRALVADARATSEGWPAMQLDMLEGACWPLRTAQSVLPEAVRLWLALGGMEPEPWWDVKIAKQCHDALGEMFAEAKRLSETGVQIDGQQLFHERYPELAALGDRMLASREAARVDRIRTAADIILDALGSV
jgi:hypothetical protein